MYSQPDEDGASFQVVLLNSWRQAADKCRRLFSQQVSSNERWFPSPELYIGTGLKFNVNLNCRVSRRQTANPQQFSTAYTILFLFCYWVIRITRPMPLRWMPSFKLERLNCCFLYLRRHIPILSAFYQLIIKLIKELCLV